jgi:hypothetical protein
MKFEIITAVFLPQALSLVSISVSMLVSMRISMSALLKVVSQLFLRLASILA